MCLLFLLQGLFYLLCSFQCIDQHRFDLYSVRKTGEVMGLTGRQPPLKVKVVIPPDLSDSCPLYQGHRLGSSVRGLPLGDRGHEVPSHGMDLSRGVALFFVPSLH